MDNQTCDGQHVFGGGHHHASGDHHVFVPPVSGEMNFPSQHPQLYSWHSQLELFFPGLFFPGLSSAPDLEQVAWGRREQQLQHMIS